MKLTTAMTLSLLIMNAAYAQDTKGGGSGTYDPTHRQVQLRDLDQMTCTYLTASEVMNQFGLTEKVDAILSSLFKVHPYMAYRIRKEMGAQSWCLTTNLKRINTTDADSMNASNYLPQVQVAIRNIPEKKVYLDTAILKKMPLDHQAMSLIHEVGHSFLAMGIDERNDKLRAITKGIYQNYVMEAKQSVTQRADNFDVMLKSTSGVIEFKTTRFGRLFQKAVNSSGEFTASQFRKLATEMPATELFRALVNDLGKSKIAALAFEERIQGLALHKSEPTTYVYSEFRADGDSLFDEVDEMKAAVQQVSNFGDAAPATREDAVEGMNERMKQYSETWKTNIGTCVLTKHSSQLKIGSAGFMSEIGYWMSFSAGFSLEHEGKSLYKTSVKNEARNHSILIAVEIGDSLVKKSQAVFDVYEQRMRNLANVIRKGTCDDEEAPGLQYFR
jgi:hypothetical protein